MSERIVTSSSELVWVFGYGSLIWRPAMVYAARRAACIAGWSRRFWQASTDHRGTVESPGRVLTLVESDDHVWGAAYAIARSEWPATDAALDVREQQGYVRLTIDIGLAAAEQAGPIAETVSGQLYVATAANPHFTGPEPLDTTAEIVRRSHGPSGSNLEYVLQLDLALATMGVADPEVRALTERLRILRA